MTLSGRAQRANINRLVFTTAAARAKAQDPTTPESLGGPTVVAAPSRDGRSPLAGPALSRASQGLAWIAVNGRRVIPNQIP